MSAVCRFYLRGCCKFGNRCKFLHDGYSSKDHKKGNTFVNYENRSSQYDKYHVDNRMENITTLDELSLTDVIEVIKTEVMQIEQRNMWPLTSFGPFKGYDNIPGFTDISPEEVHYQFYIAYKSSTTDQFRNNFNGLIHIAKCNRELYINKTESACNIAKNMINRTPTDTSNSSFSFNNAFPTVQTAQSTQQPSIFSTNNANSVMQEKLNSFSFKTGPINFQQNAFTNTCTNVEEVEMHDNSNNINAFNNNIGTSVNNVATVVNSLEFSFNNTKTTVNSAAFFVQKNNFQNSYNGNENDVYPIITYSKEEIEAFKASQFSLGHIPIKPPPKELC